MKNRICVICGKRFDSVRFRKTCGDECQKEQRRQYREKWLSARPGYMQQYFQEHKERYSRQARRESRNAKEESTV